MRNADLYAEIMTACNVAYMLLSVYYSVSRNEMKKINRNFSVMV